jgi:hypothetical protein
VRNQDYEINRRLLKSGGRIWQNPHMKAYYYNQGTLRGLLRQGWQNGKWNPWMWFVAPYALAPRHTIPGLFLGGLLFSMLLAVFFPWGWMLLAAILVPYLCLALASAIQQGGRFSWDLVPWLPFIFFGHHVAYGAGILYGCLRLILGNAPVQRITEPWPGAGRYRAYP